MADFDDVVRDMFWGRQNSACCCMGPQNGEPVCRCAMKYVKVVDGHYVQITDLGQVSDPKFVENEGYHSVVLIGSHGSVVSLMKVMRERKPSLTLQEAKDLFTDLPNVFKDRLFYEEAAELKAVLEENGGIVEVR